MDKKKTDSKKFRTGEPVPEDFQVATSKSTDISFVKLDGNRAIKMVMPQAAISPGQMIRIMNDPHLEAGKILISDGTNWKEEDYPVLSASRGRDSSLPKCEILSMLKRCPRCNYRVKVVRFDNSFKESDDVIYYIHHIMDIKLSCEFTASELKKLVINVDAPEPEDEAAHLNIQSAVQAEWSKVIRAPLGFTLQPLGPTTGDVLINRTHTEISYKKDIV